MKTRGLKDLYLPRQVAYHVRIILLCAAFTPLWGVIIKARLNPVFLIGTCSMMVADIELVLLVSAKLKQLGSEHSRREVAWMSLIGMVLFLIIAVVINTMVYILFIIVLHLFNGWGFPDLLDACMVGQILTVVKVNGIALLLTTPFILYSKWNEALKREHKLIEQNLIFQNETLRSQVNPHFLFNSLNTLSQLVVAETETAGRFISKLSSIYRYILENGTKDRVKLKEELAFIEDYFYLHKIRSEGKIRLNMNMSDVDDSMEILPVSLQLLIENAIKHNMATIEKPLIINIYREGGYVVVSNNLQKMATQIASTKIGLKNLGERVRLITGKEIIVEETPNDYIVKVPLLS